MNRNVQVLVSNNESSLSMLLDRSAKQPTFKEFDPALPVWGSGTDVWASKSNRPFSEGQSSHLLKPHGKPAMEALLTGFGFGFGKPLYGFHACG